MKTHPKPLAPAFTLVEMMVAIAIVVVLAALLLPAYKSIYEKADRTRCASNLKTLSGAAIQYSSDHDFLYLPPILNGFQQQWMFNTDFLSYLGAGPATNVAQLPKIFLCPTAKKKGSKAGINYGMNVTGLGIPASVPAGYTPNTKLVKRPSQKIMIIDALDWWVMSDRAANYTSGEAGAVFTPAFRHGQGANAAFFDGHVEHLSQSQLITNKALWDISAN